MQKIDGVLTEVSNSDIKLLKNNPSEFWRDVTIIGKRAFYLAELDEIEIPSTIIKIEDQAFRGSTLKKVVLKNGLKEIGPHAFFGCIELTEIAVPSSVELIDKCAFFKCENLKVVNLNEGLKIIEIEAFHNTGIEEITIPGSVEKIDADAFNSCSVLQKIKFSRGVKDVVGSGFSYCSSLRETQLSFGINIEEGASWVNDFENMYFLKNGDILFSDIDYGNRDDIVKGLLCAFIEHVFSDIHYQKFLLEESRMKSLLKKTYYFSKNKIKFPGELINSFNYEQFENFTNKNFKEMKNILKMCPDIKKADLKDLYALANNMGLLEDKSVTINVNGQDIPVCSYAYTVLQGAFNQGYLGFSEIHMRFHSMKLANYNEAFLRFMANKTNLSELYELEYYEVNEDFMGFATKVYEWFEERRKLVIDGNDEDLPSCEEDRYKIRTYEETENGVDRLKWKNPTITLLRKEFKNKKFFGINNENRHIAEYLDGFSLYEQKHFDKAVDIDEERRKNNVKNHLTNRVVREDVLDSIDDYKKRASLLKKECIENVSVTAKNQTDIASRIFTYEMLAKSDVANFAMGFLTSCCATLYGAGAGAQRAMILHPDMQPLVIKDIRGRIIAFGIIYVNKEEGYAVVNDFEVNRKYEEKEEARKEIYIKAMQGVKAFVTQYNKENESNPINIVTSGVSPNWTAINDYIKENPSSEILKAPDFNEFKYTGSGYWSGDWHKEQYVIWENKQEKRTM